jgi:hypothetical protein
MVVLSACGVPDTHVYTLYRDSVGDQNMRIHVASFDAVDGEAYNNENCEMVRDLAQARPWVKVRFWCEKGRFKK